MPVAIVGFDGEQEELSGFTTDAEALSGAVATTPVLAYGTAIYDTLIQAAEMAKSQGLSRSTVVLISDGSDVGSDATRAEALAALDEANVRVIAVGLDSPQYDPETLQSLATNTGGRYVETATPAELAPVFEQIGTQLSREYLITYRSVLPPKVPAEVRATVAGLPAATATYTPPDLLIEPRGSVR